MRLAAKAAVAAGVAPGRYQIHAVHTSARDIRDTDCSPVLALNRAIAVAEIDGPEVGLAAVDRLEHRLTDYHSCHATRADLLRRSAASTTCSQLSSTSRTFFVRRCPRREAPPRSARA